MKRKLLSLFHKHLLFNALNSVTRLVQLNYWFRCECFDLYKELVPYNEAWSWQKNIVKEKKALIERNEDCPDTLIVLQHSPVYTMGTGGSEEYLNFDLKDPPFQVYRTERGGEVTYHGPGQVLSSFLAYDVFELCLQIDISSISSLLTCISSHFVIIFFTLDSICHLK